MGGEIGDEGGDEGLCFRAEGSVKALEFAAQQDREEAAFEIGGFGVLHRRQGLLPALPGFVWLAAAEL